MKERKQLFAIDEKNNADKQPKLYADTGNKASAILFDNEAILRNAIKDNPRKGFEMVFKLYYKPLCSHAVRFLYSKEAAEDIVSEIFLKFWKNRLFETVTTTYKAYLYAAVRNGVVNYLKKELRDNIDSDVEVNDAEQGRLIENLDPQKILLHDELFNKIEKTVFSFSPQCQKVFLLSRFEGKKNREISSELNLNLKTVEAHMTKAIDMLRKNLLGYLKLY